MKTNEGDIYSSLDNQILYKAFQSSLDRDVIESKLLECSHPPSADFPSNYSDDSSLENFFLDDNDKDIDHNNDNEDIEVITGYQHQNDIITIADNISALNTKQQLQDLFYPLLRIFPVRLI